MPELRISYLWRLWGLSTLLPVHMECCTLQLKLQTLLTRVVDEKMQITIHVHVRNLIKIVNEISGSDNIS